MTNIFKLKLSTIAIAALLAVPVSAHANELSNTVQSQTNISQPAASQKRKIVRVVEPIPTRQASNFSRALTSSKLKAEKNTRPQRIIKISAFVLAPKSQGKASRMPIYIDPEYAN